MIGVEDEDCSWTCETPQAKPRMLTGHPRKAKSSTEINSGDLTEPTKKGQKRGFRKNFSS
ncbi:hypothetical protein AAEO50_11250 [Rossellomorea oryzaecorticis]|uniref:Uncharacterized protein n=1 Tax=Rossellomorea oryzaecorticis TaxID=1396505 RepID=A0ABU9KBU9_9BACI